MPRFGVAHHYPRSVGKCVLEWQVLLNFKGPRVSMLVDLSELN